MPRTCSICQHAKVAGIDRELIRGSAIRGIARKFRVSEDALSRHKKHVSRAVVKAGERREERMGDSLHEQMRELVGEARGLLRQAKREGDTRGAIAAVKTTAEILDRLDSMLERDGAQGPGGVRIVVTYGDGRPFPDRQPEPRPRAALPVSNTEPSEGEGEKPSSTLQPVERVASEKIAVVHDLEPFSFADLDQAFGPIDRWRH